MHVFSIAHDASIKFSSSLSFHIRETWKNSKVFSQIKATELDLSNIFLPYLSSKKTLKTTILDLSLIQLMDEWIFFSARAVQSFSGKVNRD